MRRKWMIAPVIGLVSLGLPACTSSSATGESAKVAAAPVDVGAPLYPAEAAEKIPLADSFEQTVVIPNAVIRMDKKQTVAAEVDGKMEILGTMLPPGTVVDPKDPNIMYDPNDKERQLPFQRLRIGMRVTKGQTVALLNDLEALVQIESSQQVRLASENAIKEATIGAKKIEEVLNMLTKYKETQSAKEVLEGEATLARYRENIFTSEREKAKALGDEKRAMVMRNKHRSYAAVTGVITNTMVEPGEVVRAGMPLMEILSLEDVRIEGTMEAHYADTVKPGMKVMIEPTLPVGPDMKAGRISHRQEVTDVAVTSHPNRPQVISTSVDGTATVWDAMGPAGKKMQTRLAHNVAVRSVATTGAKSNKFLAATGGDDGRIRLWDVSNPDRISDKPVSEFSDAHASSVHALCFSPDARYLVSAAGREVFVWDIANNKKLYSLPSEHKDAVTTVKFTPQAKLVTASRDKTVRVWTLGDKGAAVERTIDHRKANVDALGVSSGGGRVLFDQEDGRIEVVSLADGQPVGTIQNANSGARFAVLAAFSPDDSYVLTAGGDGDMRGELQVWLAPKPGGRGAEVRRLVTPERAMPTCAAFGPNFVVVGTQAGGVHLWTQDMLKGSGTERVGRVVSVMRSDARNAKVRVETSAVTGDIGLMQDKSTATLIIRPGDQPAALPPLTPAPGSAAVPVPDVIIPAGGISIPGLPMPKK